MHPTSESLSHSLSREPRVPGDPEEPADLTEQRSARSSTRAVTAGEAERTDIGEKWKEGRGDIGVVLSSEGQGEEGEA